MARRRNEESSFCEQKEAKKLFIPWSVPSRHPSAAPRRVKVFWVFFPKKNILFQDFIMLLPTPPSFRLDNRHALVTGAGRGLGAAIAAAVADAGAHVHLVARTRSEVEAVAEAIRLRGHLAESHVLDMNDFPAVEALLKRLPMVSVLVNNAGTNRPKPMAETSPEDFDAVFSLNVRAVYFTTQAVTRRLLEAGAPGSVITISSQMGHVGAANRTVYCASKHAIEGLTKALAVELGPHGIRVNSVAPTFIDTPLTRPYFENEAFKAAVLSKIKLGRIGHVGEVTGAVVYLASDAASLVTGTSLLVDGGWTAH
jgi:NAD(P)-dependent dehydrogenase (short-subunit alcohol dehydrogenase family)